MNFCPGKVWNVLFPRPAPSPKCIPVFVLGTLVFGCLSCDDFLQLDAVELPKVSARDKHSWRGDFLEPLRGGGIGCLLFPLASTLLCNCKAWQSQRSCRPGWRLLALLCSRTNAAPLQSELGALAQLLASSFQQTICFLLLLFCKAAGAMLALPCRVVFQGIQRPYRHKVWGILSGYSLLLFWFRRLSLGSILATAHNCPRGHSVGLSTTANL